MKSIAVLLVEALDRVSEKSADAAKKIMASNVTTEAKLAAAQELLNETSTPAWRSNALVEEIRENFREFKLAVQPTRKHNGILENSYYGKPDAAKEADTKRRLAASAKAAFNLTEAEANIFAEIPTGKSLADLIREA